jgi:hypothetical protein
MMARAIRPAIAAETAAKAAAAQMDPNNKYLYDPVAFAKDELGIDLWREQADIARSLCVFPHRVIARTANSVGKSITAACVAIWFYRTRPRGQVIITAPKATQVDDIIFKEIRRLYKWAGVYPKASRIEDVPGHLLYGFTARSEAHFQGEHEPHTLIIFDEAVGIDEQFWTAARGILSAGIESMWLVLENPTDPSSYAYEDELRGGWDVHAISGFRHPNIAAELDDKPAPIPEALRLGQHTLNMGDWGDWLEHDDEAGPGDIDILDPTLYGLEALTPLQVERAGLIFPSRYWRPGPDGEARVLGRFPSQAAYSVFAEAAFDRAFASKMLPLPSDGPVIGCDVARMGDDATAIHVRRGNVSLEHRTYRKQDTLATANTLKELCHKWGPKFNVWPHLVPCLIDDDGVGGGVVDNRVSTAGPADIAAGREWGRAYNFIPIRASTLPRRPERYPNVRSELLFDLAERMANGLISLAGLPRDTMLELRRQAIGITYNLDAAGRRVAEPKDAMKSRLGRSPDDLDAMALCYYTPTEAPPVFEPVLSERPNLWRGETSTAGLQMMFAEPRRHRPDDLDDMSAFKRGNGWNFRGG